MFARASLPPDQERIDAFVGLLTFSQDVPAAYMGVMGLAVKVNGPFPKDAEPANSGIFVVSNLSNPVSMAVVLAHEIGHYLGLDHTSISRNLMLPSAVSDLEWWQWREMVKHPVVQFDRAAHAR